MIIVLLLSLNTSCSTNTSKPEDAIYEFINNAEKLIEDHQGRKTKQLIAVNYSDEKKRSKNDLDQLITFYLLRHQKIHILKHVAEIKFSQPSACTVTVYAAMAGTGGKVKEMLATLQTDVYRFTFSLSKSDDEWLVTSADWERASSDDIAEIWGSLSK